MIIKWSWTKSSSSSRQPYKDEGYSMYVYYERTKSVTIPGQKMGSEVFKERHITSEYKRIHNTKDLLTECDVCTGNIAWGFRTDRATKEVCAIKTEGKLSCTDRANEVNKGFIIWLCWIAIFSDFVEKTMQKTLFLGRFCCCFVRRYLRLET